MGPRMEYFLKKTRPYQLLFVVVAVFCLLAFLVFNFAINDHNGAFEGHGEVHQLLEIPLTREGLETVTIDASYAKVEIGMASSLSKPSVSLSGRGYTNQLAKVDITGKDCVISLEGDNASAKELTMQILLPQNDLTKVSVNAGSDTNLNIDSLRSSALDVVIEDGYANIANVKTVTLDVTSNAAPLRLTNNKATSLNVEASDNTVTLLENSFEKVTTQTENGHVFAYSKRLKGDWNVSSVGGEVTLLSANLPYNTLIKAQSGDGGVDMTYSSRFWKDANVVEKDDNIYKGSVGNNPNKVVQVESQFGKITVGKRERFTNLDPYAKDYPYANQNPYTIERATITK